MINYIWFFMVFIGICAGMISGRGEEISKAVIASAGGTVELIIGLTGLMCLWCGVMKIAEKSGLTGKIALVLKPILKLLYKDASRRESALGAIVMNLTANMMGLSNAATPFGIKAMEELQRLNVNKERASNDMVLFLVMNAACLQLVPSTVISIRAASGSQSPGIILIPAIISTFCAALVGIICAKVLEKYF
ncbi:nucleoside recognition domain-containing protein [Clostridium polynesiense]|uniref:nucleoside recognition domain-containing protein n=1 Tax=Clostridium polynesiense TaxID=1325933 RepID=UPI0005911CCE|nr:nucleoside recognition domain-containing protein [Clostridium polynesiense]